MCYNRRKQETGNRKQETGNRKRQKDDGIDLKEKGYSVLLLLR